MLEKISEYIDLQLAGIFILIVVSFLFLKIVFKKISMPRIVAALLIIVVVGGNGYLVTLYLKQQEENYIDTSENYYIKGNIKFVSNAIDKIRMEYTATNMVVQDLEDDTIFIKVAATTSIRDRRTKQRLTLSDLKSGDQIAVTTSTSSLKDGKNEIIAVTIYRY